MKENITLIPYTSDYLIPENGKYLVRTESPKPYMSIHYFSADCKIVNGKTSIDVSNQIVTHISKDKLNFK